MIEHFVFNGMSVPRILGVLRKDAIPYGFFFFMDGDFNSLLFHTLVNGMSGLRDFDVFHMNKNKEWQYD